MALPLVYVCYGMPKSGSTLACNLSRAAARRAGHDQAPPSGWEGFVRGFGDYGLDGLLAALTEERRALLVVKTHSPPDAGVAAAVADGRVRVQAVCRDPRDIALSMRDATMRDDAWGHVRGGRPIEVPEDARRRIRNHVARFRAWADLPGALVLGYEQTAFATAETARRIARHMGVPAAPMRDALAAKRAFGQFNRGRSQRHLDEMAPAQIEEWYLAFRPFIDAYCPPPPRFTLPARLTTRVARLLGRRG